MEILVSFYPHCPSLFPPVSLPNLSIASSSHSPFILRPIAFRCRRGGARRRGGGFVAASVHSSARILKFNRKSPYGRPVSSCGSDEDEDDEKEEKDEEDDDFFDDDHFKSEEFDDEPKIRRKPVNGHERGVPRSPKIGFERSSKVTKQAYITDLRHGKSMPKRVPIGSCNILNKFSSMYPVNANEIGKVKSENYTESMFQKIKEEVDLDTKWFPLIEYLSTFGLKETDFISIYERHMPCLQINVVSARERLEFLLTAGVKSTDIRRILNRQPQILEYTVENNLKPHVVFLKSLGIPDSRIGQIITAAPSLFSYSIEQSLRPTVRYLIEEVGIKESCVSKVVQLSPQILVQRIDNSWSSRLRFLSKELGAPRDNIVKMVTKHPQVLHYSIEDGIQPRINFLRSIGMRNSEIVKVLTSLTQVLSLSLERNLKPKYLYLVNELHNEVHSLTKYPMYLSLSLEQRILPRHRFLVSLKKAPKGPFPLSSLVPSDESFCQQWAGTSLDKYLTFRQTLLLSDFAKKYKRK